MFTIGGNGLSLQKSRFPHPIQKALVEAGRTKIVYRLDVPKDSTAFIWLVANNPMPPGSQAEWIVDNELVDLPDLKIKQPITQQLASFEKPLRINPPIIAKKQVLWTATSPTPYTCVVGLDGEIYIASSTEQVIARALTEALKAAEKPSTILKPLKINVTDEVFEVKPTTPWKGFSIINDGPNPVYVMVNEQIAEPEAPLNIGDNLDQDILTNVLYLVCDKGETASVRVYGNR